jgi:hypothetical protein
MGGDRYTGDVSVDEDQPKDITKDTGNERL